MLSTLFPGGDAMRRGRRNSLPPLGCLVMLAGVLILFALVLPAGMVTVCVVSSNAKPLSASTATT